MEYSIDSLQTPHHNHNSYNLHHCTITTYENSQALSTFPPFSLFKPISITTTSTATPTTASSAQYQFPNHSQNSFYVTHQSAISNYATFQSKIFTQPPDPNSPHFNASSTKYALDSSFTQTHHSALYSQLKSPALKHTEISQW